MQKRKILWHSIKWTVTSVIIYRILQHMGKFVFKYKVYNMKYVFVFVFFFVQYELYWHCILHILHLAAQNNKNYSLYHDAAKQNLHDSVKGSQLGAFCT